MTLYVLSFAGGETRLAQLPHEIIETILLTVAVCSGMSVRELQGVPKKTLFCVQTLLEALKNKL